MISLSIIFAIALDRLWGEPRQFHPLVGLGSALQWLEQKIWTPHATRWHGALALAIVLLCLCIPIYWVDQLVAGRLVLALLVASAFVYLTIAPRSLKEHATAVSSALDSGDIEKARAQLARMVSRNTQHLTESQVAAACCESVLENGSDGIFAALFWFCLFSFCAGGDVAVGIYGVVVYRAVNTLDAMWGYKNERYLQFGWAAAKSDDLLNFLPARLVAASYALVGNYQPALDCARRQGGQWKSSNAGLVMASGAGSLGVRLGGPAVYHGEVELRPELGCDREPTREDIGRALGLVNRTLLLWVLLIVFIEWLLL